MADKDPTFDEIKKLKVAELKTHLSRFGLHVSGLKADLVARLSSYYEAKAAQAVETVESEEDVKGITSQEADDINQHNLPPAEVPQAQPPIECEIIEQDTEQKEPLMIPEEPHNLRSNEIAVSEPELDSDQKDEHDDSIVIPDSPGQGEEVSIPEEPKQDDSEMSQEVTSSSNDESQTDVTDHSVNREDVESSEQSDFVDLTEPVVVQVLDDMFVDIDKKDEDAMDPSDSAHGDEGGVLSAGDLHTDESQSEVELDRAAVLPAEAGETENVQDETLTSEPLASEPLTSELLTSEPLTSGPLTSEPLTSEPLTSEPLTFEPLTSEPLTSEPLTFEPLTSEPLTSEPLTSEPLTFEPLASEPLASESLASDPETSIPQLTEVDQSGVSPEQTNDIHPQPDQVPEKTPETVTYSERDSISAARPVDKAPSVGVRDLNHLSEAGGRGDDSGYDVDQGEQEDYKAADVPQQEPGKKKKKKKKRRKKKSSEQTEVQEDTSRDDEGIEVEYIPDTLELDAKDPIYAQFAQIFETFKLADKAEVSTKDDVKEKKDEQTAVAQKKDANDEAMDTDSDEEDEEKQDEEAGEKVEKLSKKKLKLKNRMSVAELKQHVHRPDVVEMHDVTAPDPKLLVYLKACRNTVPVPRHWCFKRKFLQGKRGIIKPAFQLPEFIQKTGIMEMREALQEKEDAKNMKAKMREKVRPKMGKIDIDYQKLHDAFFKWQTKPKMSIHGDLYYEGKEFETKLKQKKPGDLSEELRTALGMPTGQGSNLVPPPWLIAMQRYGPPPSYPNLKIPGLNAPIPEGASFGYHAGGWGKPPVDEQGRPLYGDVFGLQQTDVNLIDDDQVDSALWGELESESEESEESEEESEEEPADQSGLITPAETGLVTPSGLSSIPAGMETPDMIKLRKNERKNIEEAMEGGGEQPALYTVLPEKRVGVGAVMMGSSHVYDLATAAAPAGTKKAPGGLSEGVEVALDPSELELDPAAMQARYDEQLREQQSVQKEDFSDMVAEHAARQQKKRKKTTDSGKAAKKYKEFKF